MDKEKEAIINELLALDSRYGWSEKFSIESMLGTSKDSRAFDNVCISPVFNRHTVLSDLPRTTPSKCTFSKQKSNLTRQYFKEFNQLAFDNRLPSDMNITWSKRLTKTAGFTRLKRQTSLTNPRTVSIELSEKVWCVISLMSSQIHHSNAGAR